ncbi:hypothetical protein GCM10028857_03330 [Salinarchaeum chitinilyticum]
MTDSSHSSQDLLNSPLSIFYRSLLSSTSNAGIPVLLGPFLCVLTWAFVLHFALSGEEAVIISIIDAFTDTTWWPIFAVVGFLNLDVEEAEDQIDVAIKYIRVSSEDQDGQYGKERQSNSLDPEIENLNPNRVIEVADDWESAATMLRTNIDEIIDIVKRHPDQTLCLMIEDFDRLSRADPFEAATFLWIMTQYNVLCYFHSMGYFDFSDPDQQLMAFFGMYQARQEYNKIVERTNEGQRDEKIEGGFPARAPFGFTKHDDDDNTLYLDEQEASVIREAASELLNKERPFSEVYEDLEDEYEASDVNLISKQQFKRKFTDPKYAGKLLHNGEHVGDCPQILSEGQFEELSARFESGGSDAVDEKLDYALNSVIERFGVDASLELLDVIKGCCPDCGGDVKKWGSEKRWGHRVLRYRCVEEQDSESDSEGCGFKGPLLTGEFLRTMQSTVPIMCPVCRMPANDEDWDSDPTSIGAIQQTCTECGVKYSVSVSDDQFERGRDLPEYAIDLLASDEERSENHDEDGEMMDGDDPRSDHQKGLRDFT